jgi:hypothetical protein
MLNEQLRKAVNHIERMIVAISEPCRIDVREMIKTTVVSHVE